MEPETIMVFFPQYTPILPGAPHYSAPLETGGKKTVRVDSYCAGFVAPGPLTLQVEGSPNLSNWSNLGAAINHAGPATNGTVTITDAPRYLRMSANSAGGYMTFFAIGVGRDA